MIDFRIYVSGYVNWNLIYQVGHSHSHAAPAVAQKKSKKDKNSDDEEEEDHEVAAESGEL